MFTCLGMVVGVYGILYLEVARRPEHGWMIIAVGLLGKCLGCAQPWSGESCDHARIPTFKALMGGRCRS